MRNTDLELKKAIINNAYNNNKITKDQYKTMIESLKKEIEKNKYEGKLKEYRDRNIREKYKELSRI